jgi:arylsulfatase A-like enzyme
MTDSLRTIAVVALIASLAATGAAAEGNRPNIVLIVADDLGWTDLSCFGSKYYETPNIDSLAGAGMTFTNAYACPNCAPTRAALISGRYCPRTGVYTVRNGDRGLEKFRNVVPPPNRTELPLSEVTIAEALRLAGYATAHIGKWHLGNGEYLPTNQGFDLNIAGNERGAPGRGGYISPYNNPNIADGPEGEYLTDRLSDEAVRFITANPDRPFFLYLPYHAVHGPITGKPELIAEWKLVKPVGGHSNPAYSAMIQSLDEGVGRITQTLERLNLTGSTVVLFYSDNGGVGGYRRAGVVGTKETTDNAPLRGGKGMLYEGGVRVPMIVRYPGVANPGSVCEEPVINVDFYATLLEIAGARGDPDHKLDGTSFLSLLRSGGRAVAERPPLYWHFPGYLEADAEIGSWRTTPGGVIRDGDFKLMEFFETGAMELYNLEDDISEEHNLAATMPAKVKELHRKLVAWREATNAPMPTKITR